MLFEGCAQNGGFGEASVMQLIAVKAEQRRTPLNMHLELTYRCNEQCVHCYCVVEHGKEAEAAKRELTYEEIVRVLDQLAELGCLYVTFSGGEVLVRRDFFDIVEHARRRGFVYRVYTNGIGLTEERARAVVEQAGLLLSLSGKGLPPPLPLRAVPRRGYVDVDPAFTQIWATQVDMGLSDYDLFFTVGHNIGRPGCRAPDLGLDWVAAEQRVRARAG